MERKFKVKVKYNKDDKDFLSIPVVMKDSFTVYQDVISFVKSEYPDMYVFGITEVVEMKG